MKKLFIGLKKNLNIFLIYNGVIIIVATVFYPILPVILNYPPGSINTKFDVEFSSISYLQQFIFLIVFVTIVSFIFFKFAFKETDKWTYIEKSLRTNNIEKIKTIRRISFNSPHIVFLFQFLIPFIFFVAMFLILGFTNTADIKLAVVILTYLTFCSVISYMLSKRYFREILHNTYIDDCEEKKVLRISLRQKILLQILPLFVISILIIALLGYSALIREKGNLIFISYMKQLEQIKKAPLIKNETQVNEILSKIELQNPHDVKFYIAPDNTIKTSTGSVLSPFFIKYTKELAFHYQGHTYDYYGSDVQGAVVKLKGTSGDWIIGVQYQVSSDRILIYFIISIIALLALAIFVLHYFSKTITDDIKLISASLTEIAEGEDVNLNNKIAVTSNDEIGDLVIAFNKVQDREKKHIQNIKEQQRIIMERERLVSLGQMMGGITHNLKSPALVIAGFLERMTVLESQLEELLADETVVKKDCLKIAGKMKNELNEVKPYSSYITNLLTTARDRAVQLNAPDNQSFSIAELQAEINDLLSYELKRNHCLLKPEIKVDPQLIIKGEINSLVQVIHNIILNAIQAYKGKGGTIDLIIEKHADNKIVFLIRDYAGGIPQEIQAKLFQEMVTSKNREGSGLGLYMSHLTIKGRFGGELLFQSTEGVGVAFYIIIPYRG